MTSRRCGVFITGTDTGVGKTEIACGLLRALARSGANVVGMKPVAAGARRVNGKLSNADVELLHRDSTLRVARRWMNPYLLGPAIAPHLAARHDGIELKLDVVADAYERLAARADAVVVEGVGGFCVPLSANCDTGELARRLRLPIVLVVGMRLGCLSHALLTAEAIAARGLDLAGWVANRIDPGMRSYRDNIEALQQRIRAPLLAQIPFRASPRERRAAVDRGLHLDRLDRWLQCRNTRDNP